MGRVAFTISLLAAGGLGAGACADSPHEATSPPRIDAGRLALVMHEAHAHAVGSAGAVSPGGVPFSVRNLKDGRTVQGTASRDGAFNVRVDGTLDDVFMLLARSGSAESRPVYVSRLGGAKGEGKSGALACAQRKDIASKLIARVAEGADRACESDADCVARPQPPGCFDGCLNQGFSERGASEVSTVIESINAGLCGREAIDDCTFAPGECPEAEADPAPCVQGKCEYRPVELPTGDRCAGASGKGGTSGVLTLGFETHPLGHDVHWGPSNTGAVWIEDAAGTYIATLERWASQYSEHALYHWQQHACTREWPEPDAVSRASLDAPAHHDSTWNSKDLHGNVVPDGRYYVLIEVTETESDLGPTVAYAFEKGTAPIARREIDGDAIEVRPLPGGAPFVAPSGVTISYAPASEGDAADAGGQ